MMQTIQSVNTIDELIQLVRNNANVEVKIRFRSWLFSRHLLSADDTGPITDFSFVDDGEYEYPESEFRESLFADAIAKNALIIEEVNNYD